MKKKILIVTNHISGLFSFREELLLELINNNYELYISCPYSEDFSKEYDEKIDGLINEGCKFIWTNFSRRKINPFEEIKLLSKYFKIIKEISPDTILGYTIKPNIYGSIVSKKLGIPFIANITGLGTATENPGILQRIIIILYKYAFSDVHKVFFQNADNRNFFEQHKIALGKHQLLPGSGVNLERYKVLNYPSTNDKIEFVFMSRLMKEKGIDMYLETAEVLTKKYPNVTFHVCGSSEEEYTHKINDFTKRNIIKYHGRLEDVRDILKVTHCTIHPTYYPEGMSNVLLESAASGRPIITSNRSGTKEIVDNGINGYLFQERDTKDLINKVESFIKLTFNEKKEMGLRGREKVEREFNRKIVVDNYMNELYNINEGN